VKKHNTKYQPNPRVPAESIRMIDPELPNGRGKNQQANQNVFCRIRVVPGNNQEGQLGAEYGKDTDLDPGIRVQATHPFFPNWFVPLFPASKAPFDQSLAIQGAKHRTKL
jgi:hypothetical protein